MSLKITFLQPHVSFFPENLVAVNDDQGGLIHLDMAKMEQLCQGRCLPAMWSDYGWCLCSEDRTSDKRENLLQHFVSSCFSFGI